MNKPVTISLPEEIIEAVDAARGDVTRSLWVLRAIQAALAPLHQKE